MSSKSARSKTVPAASSSNASTGDIATASFENHPSNTPPPAQPGKDRLTIHAPFGDCPHVDLHIALKSLAGIASPDELKLAFQMLDTLLACRPFEDWEV